MVNFTIDNSEMDKYFSKFKDKDKMADLGERYLREVYNEAIHFVHIDTGELLMSIDKTPVKYVGGVFEGECFATSMHGVYEEARGGDHAFMTRAIQSANTLLPYIVEEWWSANFE